MHTPFLLLIAGLVLASCTHDRSPASLASSAPTTALTTTSAAASREDTTGPSTADLTKLAQRVATTSLGIRPGDVVVVDGGAHTIRLMEQIAIEAQKAGGLPNLWLESGRVVRSLVTEVPDKFLDLKPDYLADWYRHTTVWIGLGAFEDDKAIFADVPEAKLAKLSAANQAITGMLNASPMRGAFIDYPTTGRAAEVGLPFNRFAAMQWAGIGADYGLIAARGRALKSRFERAKQVHITSPAGTDLRFTLAGRPVILNAGIVSQGSAKEKLILNRFVTLPGGSVALAPLESSVTGVLVVPRDRCKYKPLRDARYEFAKGAITRAKAAEGDDCLQENLRVYGAPMHRLGSFTLGLNPALKVIEDGGDYRPYEAAGEVTLRLGDNQFYGGANMVPGGVTVDVPVTGATVELDGEKVAEHGALTGAATASAAP